MSLGGGVKLIVGLGNPGRTYLSTRHNIGFLVINRLSKTYGIKMKIDSRTQSQVGDGLIEGRRIILAKPLCFMNLSGSSISLLLRRYNLNYEEMLVICDDLDLSWGKIRLRAKGSSAGHRGVESIIRSLGRSGFSRLRIGIGRPERRKIDVKDYVLGRWTQKEKENLDACIERAVNYCRVWVTSGRVL